MKKLPNFVIDTNIVSLAILEAKVKHSYYWYS